MNPNINANIVPKLININAHTIPASNTLPIFCTGKNTRNDMLKIVVKFIIIVQLKKNIFLIN